MKVRSFLLSNSNQPLFIFTACEEDEAAPEEENEVEVFTDVKLVFTPSAGGAAVEAKAQDPDGAGVQELQVLGSIDLAANTEYTLTMVIENCLETPCELMNEEIEEEDEEHQFSSRLLAMLLLVQLEMEILITHQILLIIMILIVIVTLLD